MYIANIKYYCRLLPLVLIVTVIASIPVEPAVIVNLL